MHEIKCAEIWGGNANIDADASAPGLVASVYSNACDAQAGGDAGGDVYYISVCEAGDLTRIALADVAGHGASVSDVSAWLYRSLMQRMNDPHNALILTDLNEIASERGIEAMATVAIAGFFSPREVLFFSYAGHHPILINRRGSDRWETASMTEPPPDESPAGGVVTDLPLGVLPDAGYREAQIPLVAGDRLCMLSDGVLETPNRDREFYGLARLEALLSSVARATLPEIKAALLADLRKHAGGELTHDDVTFLFAEAC